MANNLEGGGRTPLLPPGELQAMGFHIVAWPLSLVGVAAAAMRKALQGLRAGQPPPPGDLPSFQVGRLCSFCALISVFATPGSSCAGG